MAVTTITIGGRADYQYSGVTYFFFAPLFIPFVILGVPIVDTAFSFLRRVVKRRSFSVADKEHLHHRLMRLGHGPRRTVAILWLWTALLSGVALIPTYTDKGNALVPVAILALVLLMYGFFFPRRADWADAVAIIDADGADGAPVEDVAEEPVPVADLSTRRARRQRG
jgi:UDP-GlcNAc:undecaprenyl-phosphate GlcNAc-1-phosphate transferase